MYWFVVVAILVWGVAVYLAIFCSGIIGYQLYSLVLLAS